MLTMSEKGNIRIVVRILLTLTLSSFIESNVQAKVLELDERFLDYLRQEPNRGWLVKFYAPWCHHCKNLEPTYANVAEAIYHRHEDLLVARVDCTKYPSLAEEFSIESFPTIMFIKGKDRFNYNGERFVDDIVTFADRLNGPRVRKIDSCQDLKNQLDSHQVIILSNLKDTSDQLYKDYTKVAEIFSTDFWFFETDINDCKGMFTCKNSKRGDIYILKLDKSKPYSYLDKLDDDQNTLQNWIKNYTFPMFTRLASPNLIRGFEANRLMVIAVLDEYQPLRKMTLPNSMFREVMKDLAKDYSENDKFQFGWSSDLSTLNSLAIKTIEPLPNLIVLAANLSYYMPEDIPVVPKESKQLPQQLTKATINNFLKNIEEGRLVDKMTGGDSFYYRINRNTYNTFSFVLKMYNGQPILLIILICLPATCLCVIIYTTCCGSTYAPDDDEVPLMEEEHEKED